MMFRDLFEGFPHAGRLVWIGVRPERRLPMSSVGEARVDAASGLIGDHFSGRSNRARQITLIQEEHLAVVAALLGRPVPAELPRRNLVVRGLNLLALHKRPFRIGTAVLRCTGYCHPCSRMETALGPGGFNAMRGHGGITAEVLVGGTIQLGDEVYPTQGDLFDGAGG